MTVQVPPLNAPQQVLLLSQTLIEMLKGRDNSVSSLTLTANATTTTVTDNLFNSDMMPALMPTSATAATAMTKVYVSARSQGSFTLTHDNTADTDRTFLYLRRG